MLYKLVVVGYGQKDRRSSFTSLRRLSFQSVYPEPDEKNDPGQRMTMSKPSSMPQGEYGRRESKDAIKLVSIQLMTVEV